MNIKKIQCINSIYYRYVSKFLSNYSIITYRYTLIQQSSVNSQQNLYIAKWHQLCSTQSIVQFSIYAYLYPCSSSSGFRMTGRNSPSALQPSIMVTSNGHIRGRHSSVTSLVVSTGKYLYI